jgi:hypothetical protein
MVNVSAKQQVPIDSTYPKLQYFIGVQKYPGGGMLALRRYCLVY